LKNNELSALDAKFEAQKIAFAPFVFQVARILRDKGILAYLIKQRKTGVSIKQISEEFNISIYGLRILLEIASESDIVYRTDDEIYSITKTGYFLSSDQLTRVNMDFTHEICYQGLFHLEEALDQGKPVGLKELGDWPTFYEGLSKLTNKQRETWLDFDHYYSDDSYPIALPIIFDKHPKTLLDVGGNTGKFSIKCCEYDKEVKVTLIDLPGQIEMASRNVAEHNFNERVDFLAIDMLKPDKPFPKADAIWMSQFLDCFSASEIVSILKHARKTMDSNTRLYIMETLWDNQEYPASRFSLAATSVYFTTIANGNSKMYGKNELIELVEEAGLVVIKEEFPIGICHTILICQLA